MEIDYCEFRAEVRTFLNAHLTDAMRAAGRLQTYAFPHMEQALEWQRVRHAHGWGAPAWPEEYGGTGWDSKQKEIFREESLLANAPGEHQQSLNMCGPCLIGYGSKAQKDFYLPRILSAEHVWCQGYSEPGSGSDLASLRTAAIKDGEDYIVTGAKIWTSNAQDATHMFCLVRTSTEGRPQQGITFLLIEMNSPGIRVEPILNLNGVHEQNHVYLDEVRVPQLNRVGDENDGWRVAKYLLEFERGGTSITPMLRRNLGLISGAINDDTSKGVVNQFDDPGFRERFAAKEIAMMAADATEQRISHALGQGESPGVLSSFTRVMTRELLQEIDALFVEAAGPYALVRQREALRPGNNEEMIGPEHWLLATPRYFDQRAATVAGGTSEVQRNIIAKTVLGL
ncbi:MAG: acyl-CoA dehydrogenase family protein [Pseudomonadota bacterium]